MTPARTETSSADTGSSSTSIFGSSASARAMPIALALAAGELPAGSGSTCSGLQADELAAARATRADMLGRRHAVRPQRLGEDVADRQPRIERRHRILEDHLQVAADREALAASDISAVSLAEHAIVPDCGPRRVQDLHDRRRLAAAGFADQPERLALADVEADAVDRAHRADAAAGAPRPSISG